MQHSGPHSTVISPGTNSPSQTKRKDEAGRGGKRGEDGREEEERREERKRDGWGKVFFSLQASVVEEREKKEEKARAGEERLLVSRWYGTSVTGFCRTGVGDESVSLVSARFETGLQAYRLTAVQDLTSSVRIVYDGGSPCTGLVSTGCWSRWPRRPSPHRLKSTWTLPPFQIDWLVNLQR